jgi:ABC-type multidrug transport system fused ATPase/permease subunit
VDLKTYWAYISAGNSKIELVAAISVFFFSQGITSFTDKWISWWTNEVSRRSLPDASLTEAQYTDETYIMVYSICVGAALFLVLTKAILYFHYCMSISVNLHESMFGSLVRSPVMWFDKNSSGLFFFY